MSLMDSVYTVLPNVWPIPVVRYKPALFTGPATNDWRAADFAVESTR